MQAATNSPYIKRYHTIDGIIECGNPITKETPFLNDGSNRRNRKASTERHRSNKKGISLIIHKEVIPDGKGGAIIMVTKVKRFFQQIKANTVLKTTRKGKKVVTEEVTHSHRAIPHYQLVN